MFKREIRDMELNEKIVRGLGAALRGSEINETVVNLEKRLNALMGLSGFEDCGKCGGKGKFHNGIGINTWTTYICPECNGLGIVRSKDYKDCECGKSRIKKGKKK